MRRLTADLAEQVGFQMSALRRCAFRGKVAVEIDLRAVAVDQPPASPPAVKAYLDLLNGIVYRDDSYIASLRVTRHAVDNPWFRETRSGYDIAFGAMPRIPHGPDGHVEVEIGVQPLRTYVADFDRAFSIRELVFGDEWSTDDEPGSEFFVRQFDHGNDDLRMDELEEEARDDREGRGIYALDGPFALDQDVLENMRAMRRSQLRALRRKLLLNLGPTELDRPGPPPAMTRLLWREHPRLRHWQADELLGPGRFLLPAPPTKSGGARWRETVHQAMTEHHGRWRMVDDLQGYALALDIAVRGVRQNPRDLDNLARDVVGPFEQVFCSDERGSVATYRVYNADIGPPGVRVFVIGDERIESFEQAVHTARDWVLTRGPRFRED
jgi:hypothetical protein